jgi:hypothetical protein
MRSFSHLCWRRLCIFLQLLKEFLLSSLFGRYLADFFCHLAKLKSSRAIRRQFLTGYIHLLNQVMHSHLHRRHNDHAREREM